MRTLHPNLASRPYRNYKPVYVVVAALALLTAALMVNNIQTAYDYFSNTKTTRARIAKLEEAILQEQRRSESLQSQIAGIDVADLNEQVRYVNAQIAERTFSWSQLLTDLERVVPQDVRLTSLNPSMTADGRIVLGIDATSRDANGLVAMLNRMLDDPHFQRPLPSGERTSREELQSFSIRVEYLPAAERVIERASVVKTGGRR